MNIRIFSKKHNLYTNSPLWPSNQRSASDWFLAPNGDVVEAIFFGDDSDAMLVIQDRAAQNFIVEPWTGYFDSRGKKIYRGDIIKLSCFDLDYEVVWSCDRFKMKALDQLATKIGDDNLYPWGTLNDIASNYEVAGNIHGVEYSD